MSDVLDRIRREPALVVGLVLALIGVASAFGLGITDGQRDGIVSLVGAVLALVGAGVTRSQVTPAADVVAKIQPAPVGTDHEIVAGPAHPAPTGTPVQLPPAVP